MSSHHFVKEGQEPALLVADAISLTHAESILEWSPLVVVMEGAVDHVLAWGVKVDIVIARKENVSSLTTRLSHQAPVRIISDEQPEDLKSALLLLIALGQKAVYIMVSDATPWMAEGIFSADIQINLITREWKWSKISTGHFVKWLPSGTEIRIHGAVQNFTNLSSHNGTLKVVSDAVTEISAANPFWLAERLPADGTF